MIRNNIKILYVTKMKNTKANGVTVAVTQLLNSISKYTCVGWFDLGAIDFDIDENVTRINFENWEGFGADIVIFEDPFNSLEFCKIAKSLRKKKIPYILSPHGCFTRVAMQKKALKKYLAVHSLFRTFFYGCFATQYLCENERINSLQYKHSLVIPNGITINDRYTVKKIIRNIVFISRKDVRHKGIDYLLKAIKVKKDLLELKGVKVKIYGSVESESDEKFINDFIYENKLSNVVLNNGAVFGKEKETVLMNADLFILTSRHEGFPMSILEALSYGLPVLITEGTNMTDLIENASAGWICKTDVEDIARTLENAVECTDCSQISKNARLLAKKYSWESISVDTIEEYAKIIQTNKENRINN